MQIPEASEEYIRKAIWEAVLDADLNLRYWDHLSRRYSRWDKYTKIFLATMSSSTVAGWGIWDEIGILWKCLSAVSAVTAIALPNTGLAEKNWRNVQLIVDVRINETLLIHSQPPKSPLSGGL